MVPASERPRYDTPPLIEAVVALQFRPGAQPWDSVYFGEILREIKGDFPRVETVVGAEIRIDEQGAPPIFRPAPELKRFLRTDGGMVVTVGPEMLGVSVLPPSMPEGQHPGWETLFSEAKRLLGIYRAVVAPGGVHMLGVRYINAVEEPLEESTLSRLFSAESGVVPPKLLNEGRPFAFRYEHLREDTPQYVHREVFQLTAQASGNNLARFVLDVDELWQARGESQPDIDRVGNLLHDAVYDAFHTLFTPEARARFGPALQTRETSP